MIDEAQPTTRMFEEDVKSLLEGFSLFMMEHIFGLKGLIDGKVNWVVGIRDATLIRTGWFFFFSIIITNVVFTFFSTVFPLHRGRHSFVMRFAKPWRTKSSEEGELLRWLIDRGSIVGIFSFTSRCFERYLLGFASDELVFATLEGSVGGCGAVPLFRQPWALVLASWKTVVVRVTWEFQDNVKFSQKISKFSKFLL